ncbi:MAG: guanine deaminase [Alphaproteobacteria bacterium]|nr:guanine deaminase [Alphaproteobacteria bacterium]
MTGKLLRGRILSFSRRPQGPGDAGAYVYLEDGGVLIGEQGRIARVADFSEFTGADVAVIDHRPHLITAGFIDPHIHFVQMQVVGSYAGSLLEWLNTYTFIEEQRFADPAHAARIASLFFDELIRHGTTSAAAYCSVHAASAEAFFAEAEKRNMAMFAGKSMMDRNCPDALRDTPRRGYDETKALIEKWHGRGRAQVAITPRFAVTSSHAQMEAIAALAREFPEVPIQTHLSENHDEIAFVGELFPEHEDYTSVYSHYGLLRPKALFGHAIHLSAWEKAMMAETGAVAVSCPTSNLFLGSGLYDLFAADRAGMRSALATDIGGGTSYSMLQTLDAFYKVQQMCQNRLDPLTALYLITRGNAEAMGLADRVGSVAPGKYADLVVLDAAATPAMRVKMERISSLAEEAFLLQTLGDDRAVAETYVAGQPVKSKLAAH